MFTINLLIEIDPEAEEEAHIFVNGKVDGHPYKFLFDTGAARSAIMKDEFSLQFSSSEKDGGSGVFKASDNDLITIPSLQIGSLVRENLLIGRMGGDANAHFNLVGMDFWQYFRCEFYFDQKLVVVDQPMPDLPDGVLHDLQTDKAFHPYIDLQFDNSTAKGVWDTGASITVVDSNFVEKHPQLFTPDGTSQGTDSTGTTFATPMYRMHDFTIKGRPFPDVRVASVDFSHLNAKIDIPMDVVIGYNILSEAHWLFDFPEKKWAFIDR